MLNKSNNIEQELGQLKLIKLSRKDSVKYTYSTLEGVLLAY